MAKSQKTKADEVTDDELSELENLEGAADEPEDEEDEVEETVKVKKGKKGKKDKEGKAGKKGKKNKEEKPSRASTNGKIGTQEIVAHVNSEGLTDKPIDARQLRMVLRKHRGEKGIELDSESGRWEWDSLDEKPVKAIIGFVKAGEVEAAKQEGLDRLKKNREDAKAKQDGDGKKKGKKGKKDKKKNKKKDEDDDE